MENDQVKKAEETKKSKRGRKPRDPNILTQALSLQILKPADPGITWQELRKALTKASKMSAVVANNCMTQYYLHAISEEKVDTNTLYSTLRNICPELSSSIVNQIMQQVGQKHVVIIPSHPARVRGLKHYLPSTTITSSFSHPARVRGLKLNPSYF